MRCLYLRTAAFLLVLTAFAKIWSASGHAKALLLTDPLFGIHFHRLMALAAIVELTVACVCLLDKSSKVASAVVAWLAGMLVLYRIGLNLIHWHVPCPCLGNLSDALHISPATADMAATCVLVYLLFGSLGIIMYNLFSRPAPRGRNALLQNSFTI